MIGHVRGVWQFRYFWASLVRLDLRNRYRRSVLGIGWSLLNPLSVALVFSTVFSNILGQNDWTWYVPYLLGGLAVWEFIKGTAVQGCDSFVRAEAYIRQCPLPYMIYPLRTVLGTLIHFAITLGVVVVLTAALQETWTPLAMLPELIAGVLLVTVFAWGLATITAFAHVYFHDTKHLLEALTQMYFFLTPIMYTRKVLDAKDLGWVADLNPVTVFMELIRDPMLTGVTPAADQYLTAAGLAAGAFGLGCGTLAWLQKKVIFHM